MNVSYPSVCPRCDTLLDHKTESPGGMEAPLLVTCPDCEYEETFRDGTDR